MMRLNNTQIRTILNQNSVEILGPTYLPVYLEKLAAMRIYLKHQNLVTPGVVFEITEKGLELRTALITLQHHDVLAV